MQAKRVHGSRRVLGALSVVVMTAAAVMVGIGARPAGAVTGSSRLAILSVIVFFAIGAVLLSKVDVAEGQRVARLAERETAVVGG